MNVICPAQASPCSQLQELRKSCRPDIDYFLTHELAAKQKPRLPPRLALNNFAWAACRVCWAPFSCKSVLFAHSFQPFISGKRFFETVGTLPGPAGAQFSEPVKITESQSAWARSQVINACLFWKIDGDSKLEHCGGGVKTGEPIEDFLRETVKLHQTTSNVNASISPGSLKVPKVSFSQHGLIEMIRGRVMAIFRVEHRPAFAAVGCQTNAFWGYLQHSPLWGRQMCAWL